MLPATLSFFLHCSPTKQQLVINFLSPSPKEDSHLCRSSPPPTTVLPKDTASWLRKRIQCTQPSILQAAVQTKSLLRPWHSVSQPPFMWGAQLLTWQTWTIHQWLPLDCQNHRRVFGVHSVGDKCEKQNQWKGNFCCFLSSGARVGLQRTGAIICCNKRHKFTWSMHCMYCLIIQKDAD